MSLNDTTIFVGKRSTSLKQRGQIVLSVCSSSPRIFNGIDIKIIKIIEELKSEDTNVFNLLDIFLDISFFLHGSG